MVGLYGSDEEDDYSSANQKRFPFLIVVLVIVSVLAAFFITNFFGSSYTGHVFADVNKISLEETAYKGSTYMMSASNPLSAKSLRISGDIIGNGSVKVYLNSGDKNMLVFSNSEEKFKTPLITGFSVYGNTGTEGPGLKVNLEDMVLDGNSLKGISLKASGYDNGAYLEKLSVSWTPDDGEKLVGIRIDEGNFWGYGSAGNDPSPKASGSIATGWGVALPDGKPKPLDSIDFNSDMADKELIIDLIYNPYLAGYF